MIVGTAGHIDHGKTSLVKVLTGVDADRLPEEKARGITIDLGFAYADLGDGEITGFVDVPGHEKLIHTMAAGTGALDAALLVVAADDGVMPQTLEHLAILGLLGVEHLIVALTKADLANESRRLVVISEIRAALASSRYVGSELIPVSVLTGEGIESLKSRLVSLSANVRARDDKQPFRFCIDRSFILSGFGTVVTGTVLSGTVRIGDMLTVSPSGLTARVRGIHAQNRPAERGAAGQRCALNITGEGISKESVGRGDILLAPELHAPTSRIDAELNLLATESKVVGTWFPARLHSNAVEAGVRIVPLDGDIKPGQTRLVQLVLDRPVAAAVGDRFILRDVSASRTIGGGRFLDLRAPARKRSSPERLALLREAHPDNHLVAMNGQLALGPVDLGAFIRDRTLTVANCTALMEKTKSVVLGGFALSSVAFGALQSRLENDLTEFHANNPDIVGVGREKLRLQLARHLPPPAFLALLKAEAERGVLALDGSFVSLAGHKVAMASADKELFDKIYPQLLGDLRFRPPRVRDLAENLSVDEKAIRRVLKLSQRLGQTDQIAHDHFFARTTVREMAGIIIDVADQAADGWFTAPTFRDRVNNGRKVAIEILDFFDRLGMTLRRGDLRRINPHRKDMFAE